MLKCRKYDYVCCVPIDPRQLKWGPDGQVRCVYMAGRVWRETCCPWVATGNLTQKMALQLCI